MEEPRNFSARRKSTPGPYFIERRRSEKRILVHVPVEVTEVNGKGHHASERTFIEDVSDFGCRFSTRGPLKQGDTISVKLLGPEGKNIPDEEPRLYEIMWVAQKERSFTVGAKLLQGEKLAITQLPPEIGGQNDEPK